MSDMDIDRHLRCKIADLTDECKTLRYELGRAMEQREDEGDRLDWLMVKLAGNVTRALLGELAHTGDPAEFRARIDDVRGGPCVGVGWRRNKMTMTTAEFFADAKRLGLRMHLNPEDQRAAFDAKDAEIERLRSVIAEAVEDIQSWAAYADQYFQQKHDLAGCIAKYKKSLRPNVT